MNTPRYNFSIDNDDNVISSVVSADSMDDGVERSIPARLLLNQEIRLYNKRLESYLGRGALGQPLLTKEGGTFRIIPLGGRG